FAFFNLALVVVLFVVVPLVNRLMLPPENESVYVDPKLLEEPEADPTLTVDRPADRLENSKVIAWIVGFAGLAYLFYYYLIKQSTLFLDVVIFTFLMFAVVLHGMPRLFLISLSVAIMDGRGIVVQFPLYAVTMALVIQPRLA